jgi:anti-sigma regulatory factor (Ser/Thr protein kinase)
MSASDHMPGPVGAEHPSPTTLPDAQAPLPSLSGEAAGVVQQASRTFPQSWPLKSYLELGAFPGAVPCARLHAKQVAWEWGLHRQAETIELLVSELTTNAVQAVAGAPPPTFIRLWLASDRVRALVEVWDVNPRPPTSKVPTGDGVPALDETGGRGLFLVATLGHRWGWYPMRQWGGKVVWCELIALAMLPPPIEPNCSSAHRKGTSHGRNSTSVPTHRRRRAAPLPPEKRIRPG